MRERSLSLVATIATSVTIACSDAAVENPTAPTIAATPASPVANYFPTAGEILATGWTPSALGIQITISPFFEAGYSAFVVRGTVRFQAANEVSASIYGWLINRNGAKVNEGSAGFSMTRFGIPVAQGDTTLTVRISTNNITCGLTGKSSYRGVASTKAVGVIVLFSMSLDMTYGPDMLQPECPPPPPPPDECDGPATRVIGAVTGILASTAGDCEDAPAPPGGGSDPIEVCYTVWREYWFYDYLTGRTYFLGRWPIGTVCYTQ